MKRIGMMMLVAAMCVSVTACGRGNADNTPTGQETTKQETTIAAAQGYRSDVSCADIESAVAGQMGEDYIASTNVTEVEHLGLTADMYTDFAYKCPMISINVDTFIVVKAAKDRVEDVKTALENYRNTLIEDTFQYPNNLVKIQNSAIRVYGDYVAFIQLGADNANAASAEAVTKNPNISDDDLSKIEADAITEQNERAAKIIEDMLMAQ